MLHITEIKSNNLITVHQHHYSINNQHTSYSFVESRVSQELALFTFTPRMMEMVSSFPIEVANSTLVLTRTLCSNEAKWCPTERLRKITQLSCYLTKPCTPMKCTTLQIGQLSFLEFVRYNNFANSINLMQIYILIISI